MADYAKMYYTMMKANEDAINILIEAQKKCEEMYISAPEADIRLFEPAMKHLDGEESSGSGKCINKEI